MLQKYYNRNNSVTNGESGSKSAIVKSGHQIIHAKNWKGVTMKSITMKSITTGTTRALVDKLQAGSCTQAASCHFEELANILGDSARIYYADEDLTICIGWQIFPEGEEPHAFHPCDDEDKAFRKLERCGFRF